MKFESVFDLVGKTPLVKFGKHKNAEIYIKMEGFNPTNSLKDRPVKEILFDLKERGLLEKNKTILDASSGSFGCSLAYFGKILGIPVEIITNSKITEGNKKFLEIMGAKTKEVGETTGDGNKYCKEVLLKENPNKYIFCDQINNPVGPKAHYKTTGPEILEDMPDVSMVCISYGSGSAMLGAGSYLKEKNPDIKIVSPVAKDGENMIGTYKPGDYLSPFIKEFKEKEIVDLEIEITRKEAQEKTKFLLEKGFFVGEQTGGVFQAAIKAIDKLNIKGKVVILSGDGGWKNLEVLNGIK